PDSRIERDHAAFVREQWIDVDLANLWVPRNEITEPHQRFCDLIDGGGRPVAIALQQPPDPRPPHEIFGDIHIEWRQGLGRVRDNLDSCAASAEKQDWPERTIDRHPSEQLLGTGAAEPWLNTEAPDPSMRQLPPDGR